MLIRSSIRSTVTHNCARALLIYFLLLLIWLSMPAHAAGEVNNLISKPGEYAGYSSEIYDQWTRTSQYLTVRDGTMLAADIFRPLQNGKVVETPLPVIWSFERYHRADVQDGKIVTILDREPWLRTLIRHGYVVAAVDIRGTGASFGTWAGFSSSEATDGYDVTEWFAAQPWCNQRVGMYGRSYQGIIQFMVAATNPPHLRAIFPEMAMFDLYGFVYAGGVFREDFARNWERLTGELDVKPAAPVDGDERGEQLNKAIEMHRSSKLFENFKSLPYRDSVDPQTRRMLYQSLSPSSYAAKVSQSNVAIYQLAGWYDIWTRDAFLWFRNLKNAQKLIIGPWFHQQDAGVAITTEHLRWYDYWLKDIPNGVADEAPICYYTKGAPRGTEWRCAAQWPLPSQQLTPYYFQSATGITNENTTGHLDTQPLANTTGADNYTINYSTTSGSSTRWTNGYGGAFGYQNMNGNDQKGLTYTTAPLAASVELTGHPVVHLWVNSKARDADLFVYLEEVYQNGQSQYVTEGNLRASHSSIVKPDFDFMGLPYHRGFARDVVSAKQNPVEFVFDLLPTSKIFPTGSRIRVTITGADRDNFSTPIQDPPPVISILRNSTHASHIVLPTIPTSPSAPSTATFAGIDTEPSAASRSVWFYAATAIATVLALALLYAVKRRGSAQSEL